MRETYVIGQKIYFVNLRDHGSGQMIPTFYTESDGIPHFKLKHGGAILSKNEGEIIDRHKQYYLIKFKADDGKYTIMGFLPKDFRLEINTIVPKEGYQIFNKDKIRKQLDDLIIIHNPSNPNIAKPRRDKPAVTEIPMIKVKER